MTSLMRSEALESPGVTERLLARAPERLAPVIAALRQAPPRAVLTVARGSSDHAASFLAYLIMQRTGRLVTSLPMSLATLYDAPLDVTGALAIAVSQSGQSPDITGTMRVLRARGARGLALLNVTASPLAQECDWLLPLEAGAEKSVAATKSCLAALALSAAFVAAWHGDAALTEALGALPQCLHGAARAASAAFTDTLAPAQRVLVAARGPGLAVAQEAALKLKETCALQAEAFSGAELRHGPMALIERDYPLIIFATRGPAFESLLTLADDMGAKGARVLLIAPEGTRGACVTFPAAADPVLDPLPALLAFYLCAEQLARARGLNPDVPRHLNKVTLTR